MAKSSSQNTRLVYGDFIPIKGGPSGKARNYVSQSTGEVIPVRQFQKNATRVAYTPPAKPQKVKKTKAKVSEKPSRPPPKKPSKTISPGATTISRGPSKFAQISGETNTLSRYYHALDGYIKRYNEEAKNFPDFVPLTRNSARQSKDFQMHYQAYKNTNDRQKGGKRHMALIYFGFLEEDDDYY